MTRSVSFGLAFAAIVVAALILGFCSSTKNGTDTAAPGQGSTAAPSVATGASSPSEPTTAPASTPESGDGTATAPEVIAPADTGATAGATGEAPSLTTSPTASAEASITAPAVPNTGSEAATAAPSASATGAAVPTEVVPPAAESAGDATASATTAAVADSTAASTESAGDADTPTTSTAATAAADGTTTAATPPTAADASAAQSPAISVVTVVPAETQQAALPSEDANGGAAPPAAQEPVRPSFDVVRVDPSGNLVLAGRGAPGVEIVVTSDGQVVGTVTSDAKGEWVIVPTAPMAPGNHQLALTQKQQDGKVIGADKLVMIAVPERGKNVAGEAAAADEGSLVVMVPSDDSGGAVVLQNPTQKPAETAAAESDGIASGALVLDAVDYDDKGAVTIGGRGTVGAAVRIYLDNQLIGSSTVDASGRWQVTPTSPVEPRLHTLRVDQIAPDGKVAERVESPFLRAERIEFPADQAFIVQPGNSLWRIARRTYGEGVRYTTIYQANSEQIRDPDLIYPGQVFSIPPQAQTN